jgi:hypothetical protein
MGTKLIYKSGQELILQDSFRKMNARWDDFLNHRGQASWPATTLVDDRVTTVCFFDIAGVEPVKTAPLRQLARQEEEW